MNNNLINGILEYLETTDTHPTAREIFYALKIKFGLTDPEILQQELDHLENEQKITSVISVGRNKHYDIKLNRHYHFICKNCGAVRDVDINRGAVQMIVDHAQRLINSFAKITTIGLGFQGICHNCRNK